MIPATKLRLKLGVFAATFQFGISQHAKLYKYSSEGGAFRVEVSPCDEYTTTRSLRSSYALLSGIIYQGWRDGLA